MGIVFGKLYAAGANEETAIFCIMKENMALQKHVL
jgi:hypothetical protein